MKLLTYSLAFFLAALSSQGAVPVNISGGDVTALTVTFADDIIFNNVPTGGPPIGYGFVLLNVVPGNFTDIYSDHTGTAGWNGTGGDAGDGGFGTSNTGDATTSDIFASWLFGDQPALAATMTLNAGFRTSVAPGLGIAYPQGLGNYEIRMIDFSGNFIGDAGVVPEPSTYAALAGLAALGFVAVRRRKRA